MLVVRLKAAQRNPCTAEPSPPKPTPRDRQSAKLSGYNNRRETEHVASYLVTGGGGFIGSTLVRALLEQRVRVRAVDDFSTGSRSNLDGVSSQVELIEGDLSDPAVCQQAVGGMDYVLHQAAIPSVARSVEDPVSSNRANVTATLNLLVAARDVGAKRFVFASSSSVYGETEVLPKVETMPENPISPYALSKLAGEKYCVIFHRIYGLPTVCLRYFNIFGPRQNPDSPYSAVISRFATAALNGKRPAVHGDGEQSRDFTFVDNVVQANLLACTAVKAAGGVFNIGTGERHSLNQLLRLLSVMVGRELDPEHTAPRAGDVRHSLADIERARRVLGYEPRVRFEEGLRRTVEWYRSTLS
jgi:UDP-N-acetylglucosamine/UDP-N-acetyl-alpha-D-glucosaminouronate 4-epimerase